MKTISNITNHKVEFYDIDSMNVMWHGNYVKLIEAARCRLLDKIGYNYMQMKKDGYAYPIVKMDFKHISPAFFGDELRITSTITNYDGLLKIAYEIYNNTTNKLCARASTSQASVMIDGFQTMFTLNREFLAKIEVYLENN